MNRPAVPLPHEPGPPAAPAPGRRWLAWALAATVAVSAALALQDDGSGVELAPAARRPAGSPPAAAPRPRTAAADVGGGAARPAPVPTDPAARQRWPALPATAARAWDDDAAAPATARAAGVAAVGAAAASAPPRPPAVPANAAPPGSAATPPPAAPPFTYTLIGHLEDGGRWVALLGGPERGLSVREGDVVDGQWRVLRVRPGALDLLWLPRSLPVHLALPT